MSRDTNPSGISSYTKAREKENNQLDIEEILQDSTDL
jgi:hypothetical protein